jgi:hypothetical protein
VAGWQKPGAHCQIKLPSLQSIRLSTSTDEWLRLRTKKGLQGGKTIQQRSELFASLVPNASTSSLAHALALFAHMYLCLLSFAWLPHCCSFPELGPMTQIDLSASLLLHLNSMTERTNRIGDLSRHRVS